MDVLTKKTLTRCILTLLLIYFSPVNAAGLVQHEIRVHLSPAEQRLHVVDRISLPAGVPSEFLLHRGLDPKSPSEGVSVIEIEPIEGAVPLALYRVMLPAGRRDFTLEYAGRIAHEFTRQQESPGRSHQRLSGTISDQGVYLDAASGWYPRFPGSLQRFSLEIDLPQAWLAVSQGQGPGISLVDGHHRIRWSASHPQDDIYLIAASYKLYRKPMGALQAQVFLRQPDPELAQRYLDATETYIETYQRLIGAYPYAKFALVENFWESGYGMSSFTLLGPQVIRLPFILHSSYPHEILHNWWGNSVYVDYDQGNWSEGLTSYLADHLIAEQQGKGAEYRRNALQRYGDYVSREKDFPLREFRSRHTTASQAVGYDKSLMMFHMLRRKLGDEAFIQGLRNFYRQYRFKVAGYAALQQAFEKAGNRDLRDFFRQWTHRSGAPALSVNGLTVEKGANGYRLLGSLSQTQSEPPFAIDIPIAIQFKDRDPMFETLPMHERDLRFELALPEQPSRVTFDPWFDLFRQLDNRETPVTLSRMFSAEQLLILLPAAAPKPLLAAYRQLAQSWAGEFPQAEILSDRALARLPDDRPILLLGWDNRFVADFARHLPAKEFAYSEQEVNLLGERFNTDEHSFALTGQSDTGHHAIVWIGSNSIEAIAGLTRKLPHYGKYSALAFAGPAPINRLKRQWPVSKSPLNISLEDAEPIPIAAPPALVTN